MSRFPLFLAIAAIVVVTASVLFDRPDLYAGKVIRLADGSRYTLVAPDSNAIDWWQVRVAKVSDSPVIVSLDAEDLLAAERGEFPPYLLWRRSAVPRLSPNAR